jgi:hypothetical protein
MCHPVVLGPRHIAYGLAACVAAAAAEVVVDEEVVLLDVLLLAVVVEIVVVGVGGEDADVVASERGRTTSDSPWAVRATSAPDRAAGQVRFASCPDPARARRAAADGRIPHLGRAT